MGIAWIATFDDALDASVRRVWASLEAEKIGTTPGQLGEKPHISLFLGKDEEAEAAAAVFDGSRPPRMDMRLEPLGIFLGPSHVLYLTASPTERLLRFHREIDEMLGSAGVHRDPQYIPGTCVFHCTLAVDLKQEDLPRALKVLEAYDRPFEGRLAGMELVSYFPVRVLRDSTIGD